MMNKKIIIPNPGFNSSNVRKPINKSPLVKKWAGRGDTTIAHVG